MLAAMGIQRPRQRHLRIIPKFVASNLSFPQSARRMGHHQRNLVLDAPCQPCRRSERGGVQLWLVNDYIPMDGKIKSILNVVVVIAIVLWLLRAFGLLGSLSAIQIGR
jgi:hypothetical protein